jgi:hypothetical protein
MSTLDDYLIPAAIASKRYQCATCGIFIKGMVGEVVLCQQNHQNIIPREARKQG